MKRIGIMTMQRIKNYGSFLQAYGLKKNFEELGCDVEFVDYHFERSLVNDSESVFKRIKRNVNIRSRVKRKRIQNKYDLAFEKQFIPELCKRKMNYTPKNIDALVVGSDEVFNCLQGYPVGYSRELFGMGFDYCSVYSYAASFGQVSYKRLVEYGISDEVGSLLKRFKRISVRDNNSFEAVLALTKKKPLLHLDPVLVTDYSSEMIDKVKLRDYIILYAYPGRLTKKEEKMIKQFAKKHNKKIVGFGMYQGISDIELIIHPFEIFSYFKHADFVITDTFHGSIFSIKTHTNYCTIIRDTVSGNSNKLEDLLFRLKQDDRIIRDIQQLEDFYKNRPRFEDTDKIIEAEKVRSREYLKGIVNADE